MSDVIDEPETDTTCGCCGGTEFKPQRLGELNSNTPAVRASGDMEPPTARLGPEPSGSQLGISGGRSPIPPVVRHASVPSEARRSPIAPRNTWKAAFSVAKYREGESEPYETLTALENIALNAGLSLMLDLLIGAGGTTYAHANARICVGNGSTAAVKTQTDLQGASKLRKLVDVTYPTRSAQTLTFVATFGSSEANFQWLEMGIANSASGATLLNRKVHDWGLKESGETWVATALILGQ